MRLAFAFLLAASATLAQPPLPGLRIEPAGGGSVVYVKNVHSQPLTAFLLELVDYPGSSFTFWQDAVAGEPIAPGAEKKFSISNMTVGAAPDYVKVQAALYADGGSSGIPAKVAQLIARRKLTLATTREMIRRIEKAQSSGVSKATLTTELKRSAEETPGSGPARPVILGAISRLDHGSFESALNGLREAERALAASKPAL